MQTEDQIAERKNEEGETTFINGTFIAYAYMFWDHHQTHCDDLELGSGRYLIFN